MKKLQLTLGLARRAGKVLIGETLVRAIAKNKIHLVLIASDASDNSKKMMINKCKYYKTEYVIILTKEEMSKAISKGIVSSIGINDVNFVKKIKLDLKDGENYGKKENNKTD